MKSKVFIACDTTSTKKIKEIISKTKNSKIKIGYKFGFEFLNSKNGRAYLSKIRNKTIFADLKLHDIPNTCTSAINAIKDLKVNYLTIHISSGLEALKAAKKASGKIKLIGVTILTSLNNKALKEIGFDKDVKKLVLHQARLASKARLDAIVCSAQEVKLVKKVFKKEIITPGIRFSSKKNDQKRTLTPKQAIANGANWLVIGRDITKGNIKKNIKKLIGNIKNKRDIWENNKNIARKLIKQLNVIRATAASQDQLEINKLIRKLNNVMSQESNYNSHTHPIVATANAND